MIKRFILFLLLSTTLGLFCFGQSTDLQDNIRIRLELDQPDVPLNVRQHELFAKGEIYQFYTNRLFNPVWTEKGVLTELAYELRFEINQSKFDGLNPQDYHLDLINQFFFQFETNKKQAISNALDDLADVDLLLSDAFFHLAAHLEVGKVDPKKLAGDWEITTKTSKVSYPDLLKVAVEKKQIRQALETLYPTITVYKKGREVIRAMDEIRKQDTLNWKSVKVSKTIKVGETNGGIPNLRERLAFWKYLGVYSFEDEKEYDSTMFVAVQKFQQRNGLEPDGALGKNTINALNQSPADLIDKAAVNMERLRWLPDTLRGAEMILVNIANYQLDYLSNRDTLFSTRVIVGKKYHESPIFSSAMSYIVFSPYIHDTPARSLFTREDRALSHGCIRLQDPASFAALLLKGDKTWTPEKINTAMHQNHEQIVTLDRKIPVVLLYLTFWADSKGQGHFRQDIYDRDAEVLEALRN